MHYLNTLLKKYFKESGMESGLLVNKLRGLWPELVGEAVSAHTSPESVDGKVITLTVDTPQWMHHLGFFKEDILTKLKPYGLTDVRFRLGKTARAKAAGPKPKETRLSDRDISYIEKTLKDINDPELKEKLRALITHGLAGEKKKKV